MTNECDFKTGEDVNANITISVKDENGTPIPIGNFNQIVFALYYNEDNVKNKFSWHALDVVEASIVAEAASEGVTLNPFSLNGDVAELKIPKVDTDTLSLTVGESVQVQFDLALQDTLGNRVKKQFDKPIGSMLKSVVEGWL